MVTALTDPWALGGVPVANRLLLAPLAGIGNWFVRLQARRHGAGLAVSEMVSSHAVHHGNPRTIHELLRIHPEEHPVSVQLFGQDPRVMRSAAERVAAAGADLIDLNMGCPVPKVTKTGAGAALLDDHDLAVALARAAAQGGGVPVTVKLRSGRRPGERGGFVLAHRLVEDAGVAGILFHPRSAAVRHRGDPDYDLAAELAATLPAPVVLSGGMDEAEHVRRVFRHTGCAAVMLARGALGNPWLFEEVLGRRGAQPSRDEVLDELGWVLDRAAEHLGGERAARYLRTFYPWYLERLAERRSAADALVRTRTLEEARQLLEGMREPAIAAAA